MAFEPALQKQINLFGMALMFSQDPRSPGQLLCRPGQDGQVYQLQTVLDRPAEDKNWSMALKVIPPALQSPHISQNSAHLHTYARLPGLKAASRHILVPENHQAILNQFPELRYAVLMPWIEGETWSEAKKSGLHPAPYQALVLARALAAVLAKMESQGLAHNDLSDTNLMVPGIANGGSGAVSGGAVSGGAVGGGAIGSATGDLLALVDLEDAYGPGFAPPARPPAGTAGYAHPAARGGAWSPGSSTGLAADRFAGALLLGEILGWCDPQVRQASHNGAAAAVGTPADQPVLGHPYFAAEELTSGQNLAQCDRLQILLDALNRYYGSAAAQVFLRAWSSPTLDQCPTFAEWQAVLGQVQVGDLAGEVETADSGVDSLLNEVQSLAYIGMLEQACAKAAQAYRLEPARAAGPYAEILCRRAAHKERAGHLEESYHDYSLARRIAPPGVRERAALQLEETRRKIEIQKKAAGAAAGVGAPAQPAQPTTDRSANRAADRAAGSSGAAAAAQPASQAGQGGMSKTTQRLIALLVITAGMAALLLFGNIYVRQQQGYATQTAQMGQTVSAAAWNATQSAGQTQTAIVSATYRAQTRTMDAMNARATGLAVTSTFLEAQAQAAKASQTAEVVAQTARVETAAAEARRQAEEANRQAASQSATQSAEGDMALLRAGPGWDLVYRDAFADAEKDSGNWKVIENFPAGNNDDIRENVMILGGSADSKYWKAVYPIAFPSLMDALFKSFTHTDFYLAADIKMDEGSCSRKAGLVFNLDPDTQNYYVFDISNDQFFEVVQYRGGQPAQALMKSAYNQRIRPQDPNHLEVISLGGQYVFAINGQHAGSLRGGSLGAGYPGLFLYLASNSSQCYVRYSGFRYHSEE